MRSCRKVPVSWHQLAGRYTTPLICTVHGASPHQLNTESDLTSLISTWTYTSWVTVQTSWTTCACWTEVLCPSVWLASTVDTWQHSRCFLHSVISWYSSSQTGRRHRSFTTRRRLCIVASTLCSVISVRTERSSLTTQSSIHRDTLTSAHIHRTGTQT